MPVSRFTQVLGRYQSRYGFVHRVRKSCVMSSTSRVAAHGWRNGRGPSRGEEAGHLQVVCVPTRADDALVEHRQELGGGASGSAAALRAAAPVAALALDRWALPNPLTL